MTALNVLLISAQTEDHARARDALNAIRGQPYHLEVATTLADALALTRRSNIGAILLDLALPDNVGLTTFLRLQPKVTNVPIIILHGPLDEELAAEAVERGALDLIAKSDVSPQLLEKMLRYATERTHTMLALKASEQRYRELFQNVTAGVFQTTPEGRFMAANPALVRMLGYDSEDELLEVDVARDIYMDPDHRQNWARAIFEGGEVRNAELVLKRKDGAKIVVLENSRAVRDAEGRVLFYEGTLTDITAAHELSQQLSYDASHDPLTGLVNRREFEMRLQRALELCQAAGAESTVLFMDLDRFKTINDTCGHVAGDELLRQLAQLLQQRVRANDVVARLGGDEFGVLLNSCGADDAQNVASSVLQSIGQFQFVWGAHRFNLGASIGLVPLTQHFKRLAQVLNAADTACYAAKDSGRNRVFVYQEDSTLIARRHGEMDWVARSKRALAEGRLYLDAQLIQPLAATDELPSYELLVRMRDEQGRSVPPGAFLPSVERYNLSVRYDRWVIGAAIDWMRRNPRSMSGIGRFFVNLSRDAICDAEMAGYVRQSIAQAGIDARKLGFEITEGVAIGHLTKVNHLISDLRRVGCVFALDDFGSGVSSFAYLKALGADLLKIDGMFVGNISQDKVDYAMVRSIKDIGHVMGKKIIAESVETPEVLDKLREIGVDYAQGFGVGEPRALEQLGSVTVSDLLN